METIENQDKNSYCCGGRGFRPLWIFLGIIGFTAFVFLFGAVIMWLWNWLMPVIFHLGVISYWQAVGLAILGRLLFGSFHHGHMNHHRGRGSAGFWRHGHHKYDNDRCKDYYNSGKWNYYDQFWSEEGERAFNDYVTRKTENP